MSIILDGRIVRDNLRHHLAARVRKLKIKPALAIVQVGDMPASNVYIRQKKLFGHSIGVTVIHRQFPTATSTQKLVTEIKKLNKNPKIWGIVIQLPLPSSINTQSAIDAVAPNKDPDGLVNKKILPATARGIIALLDYYQIPIAGKDAIVVGRSNLVGKPIARALLERDATVTIAHSKTKNLVAKTRPTDILVVATGRPKLIGAKHVQPGQTVIDVGISPVEGKLIGDVDFKKVALTVHAISPVPGGVGPLTVASLFQNLLDLRSDEK